MEDLDELLNSLIESCNDSDAFHKELEELNSVYPFNRYEYIIIKLLNLNVLKYEEYLELRDDYISSNLYLPLYEITAPRKFGDTWAFGHLTSISSKLKKANKKQDPEYTGQYDLFCYDKSNNHISIEVKASRATNKAEAEAPIYEKALSSYSEAPFLMNYQQLKPSCADVFIWITVYRDVIEYRVLSSEDIRHNPFFTPQHRNNTTANRAQDYDRSSIYEGQIMLTQDNIEQFKAFLVEPENIYDAVCSAHNRPANY